jgi:hypothetical protein
MRNLALCFIALAALLLTPELASGQANTATLTVTGNLESSMSMAIVTAPGEVTVAGNAINLGTVSAHGTTSSFAPGVQRTQNGNSFYISTSVATRVTAANSTGSFYNLRASVVDSSDMAASLVWSVNGDEIGSTAVTVGYGMQFGADENQWIRLEIPYSAAPGNINAVITFVAIPQ